MASQALFFGSGVSNGVSGYVSEVYSKILRVRLKPDLYEALAEVASAEGHASLADWDRQLMVMALRRYREGSSSQGPWVTLPEVGLGGSSSVSVSLPESVSVTSMGGDTHREGGSPSTVTLPEGVASSLPGSDSSPVGGPSTEVITPSSTLGVDPSSSPMGGPSSLGDPLSVTTSSPMPSTDDLSWLDGVEFDVGK